MSQKKNLAKRTIKFLSICRDKSLIRTILKQSPNSVIKAICNAALNAERGDVHLSRKQKHYLAQYRKQIRKLTSRDVPLAQKRKAIQIGGAGFLAAIPLILSTVLSSIGSAFASRQ
jgi:hypothetical protein